jgi:hypothetical protein
MLRPPESAAYYKKFPEISGFFPGFSGNFPRA